jgi:hypothetical protein
MPYRINPFTGNFDLVSFQTVIAPLTIDTFQNLFLPVATTSADGYLSATDWALFNGKQNFLTAGANISITTVGTVTTISSTGGGGGGSFTPLPNGGIDIDVTINPNVISTIYNTAIGNNVMSNIVGGAPSLPASVWKTKTIVQALDTILFPLALPTYTVTTISLTGTVPSIVEVGRVVSQTLTITANKNDAGGTTTFAYTQLNFFRGILPINSVLNPTVFGNPGNIPNQFGYNNPNNPNKQYIQSYSDSGVTINSGTTSWLGKGNYNAGLPKPDNFGALDTRTPAIRNVNAPQASETGFTSNAVTVTGIYPYYVYKSATVISVSDMQAAIANGTATGYLSSSTGTIIIPAPTANGQFVAVAYPASSPTKTIWYVNITNNSTIPGGVFGAANLAFCNSPAPSPFFGFWTGIQYKIHLTLGLLTELSQMELRN